MVKNFFRTGILISIIYLLVPLTTHSAEVEFNIDPSYDYVGRSKVSAFLSQIGENAYFFVESEYYQNLDTEEKKQFIEQTRSLVQEFDNNIYSRLRDYFGSEWNPGVDKEDKITVLLTRIKGESGGYFNSGDEYPKIQSPESNEREMVYLNVNYLNSPLIKGFLAHEFTHLITFNQKDRIRGISEEVWINEARAEAAITMLGYDSEYQGSNLQKRVKTFLQKTNDSLAEWKNESSDYGVINLFFQYLMDRYGAKTVGDSMKNDKTGIASLDEALKNQGFSEDFSQIFTDWTVAVLANDCAISLKYCYSQENLKTLKIVPQLNYLPSADESTLTLVNYAKNWQGNWYKFIGSQGTLKLEFIGDQKVKFKVPYLLEDFSGKYSVGFLGLNGSQRATTYFADFGRTIKSLIIIPSIQSKMSGFDGIESFYQFIVTASIIAENPERKEQEQKDLLQSLLLQIDSLRKEIARLQSLLAAASDKTPKNQSLCLKIESDLYYGMSNNAEVRCLQEFLGSGENDGIYPEKIANGNFFSLTRKAVIRFQEKYGSEILAPLGLKQGTGFVGLKTRQKINQLLSNL